MNSGKALRQAAEISKDPVLMTRLSNAISPNDAHAIDLKYHKLCWTQHVFHVLRVHASDNAKSTMADLPMQMSCLIELINLVELQTQNEAYITNTDKTMAKNKILQEFLFVSEVDSASAYSILAWLSYITFSNCPFHSRSFASWMCRPYLLHQLQGSKELMASVCLSASRTSQLLILEVSYPSATVCQCWVVFLCLLTTPKHGYMCCFCLVHGDICLVLSL